MTEKENKTSGKSSFPGDRAKKKGSRLFTEKEFDVPNDIRTRLEKIKAGADLLP
ncbi:hypothetical protein [Akkermansia muciniphila]|uniref:hypothetical protein n=1 Tax=Akkermansia muciniphila TaxID=239935 RepID=UPI00319DB9FC